MNWFDSESDKFIKDMTTGINWLNNAQAGGWQAGREMLAGLGSMGTAAKTCAMQGGRSCESLASVFNPLTILGGLFKMAEDVANCAQTSDAAACGYAAPGSA